MQTLRKRLHHLSVRLSDREHSVLAEAFRLSGVGKSTFVREAIMAAAIHAIKAAGAPARRSKVVMSSTVSHMKHTQLEPGS